jgi:hypothetical protein
LDHLADVDADFLVFYRIDLRDPELDLSAGAFTARAFRLFNFRGAMRDALTAEQMEEEKRGGGSAPAPAPAAQRSAPAPVPQDPSGTKWVSPDEMRVLFPDLFQGG